MIMESNSELLKTEFGRKVHDLVKSGNPVDAYMAWGEGMQSRKDPLKGNDAITRTMWERITTAAEKYNQPGKFTALIGFEWTSSPDGNNLHRNVIFRDGKGKADLSGNDEFADFETWDKGSFGAEVHTADMLPREYAREPLKRGLAMRKNSG
jgi:hypothetical protein